MNSIQMWLMKKKQIVLLWKGPGTKKCCIIAILSSSFSEKTVDYLIGFVITPNNTGMEMDKKKKNG